MSSLTVSLALRLGVVEPVVVVKLATLAFAPVEPGTALFTQLEPVFQSLEFVPVQV